MQIFARNKLVTVHQEDSRTLAVYGVLEDDMYGLNITARVGLEDLTLQTVDVAWTRYTTPECPRAVAHIKEVEGFSIDDDIEQKLKKSVGRTGCRHYATLLIECCKVLREAAAYIIWQRAVMDTPGLALADVLDNPAAYGSGPAPATPEEQSSREDPGPVEISDGGIKGEPQASTGPAVKKEKGGIIIDLHVHTSPASPCADDGVDQIIRQARHIGLDGICLTDHNYWWQAEEVEALRQKHGFLVLNGTEVTTDQGHMLVFGLDQQLATQGIISLKALQRAVRRCDGFIIAAHPFRGFLTFGVGKLGLTVEKAAQRPLFRMVDAVETLNGMVTGEENNFAARVSRHLGLPSTGGSDAHRTANVGAYATRFENSIRNSQELLEALKAENYAPVAFNQPPETA